MDNLSLYEVFLEQLTPAQQEVFPGMFVGRLSKMLPKGKWVLALNDARRAALIIRPEPEASVRDVTHRRKP